MIGRSSGSLGCLNDGMEQTLVRDRGIRFLAAPGWEQKEFLDLLALAPDELAARAGASVLSTVPSTKVIELPFDGQRLYFKYFLENGAISRLKGMLRGSKAARALKGARLLSKAGILTPCIVALSEPAGISQGWQSMLVTLHMEGQTLRVLLRSTELAGKARAGLASSLGRLVARLHGSGLVHGDLHPGNVMALEQERHPETWTFCFMDTERVKRTNGTLTREMIRDLALLNHPNLGCISRTDRFRFIASYVEKRSAEQGFREFYSDIKGLSRQIQQVSEERYGARWRSH